MNTIVVRESNLPEIIILPNELIDEFIFREFEIMFVLDKELPIFDVKFKITLEEDGYFCFDLPKAGRSMHCLMKVPEEQKSFDFFNDKGEKMCITETFYDYDDFAKRGSLEYGMRKGMTRDIIKIMAYIMNEGKKRSRIIKKSGLGNFKYSREHRISTSNNKIWLFDDIVQYTCDNYIKHPNSHSIQCPCWEVRGHYRHYKSGKVVFIPSYRKGKQRDTAKPKDKEYYA